MWSTAGPPGRTLPKRHPVSEDAKDFAERHLVPLFEA
jgi:hypothetical protein